MQFELRLTILHFVPQTFNLEARGLGGRGLLLFRVLTMTKFASSISLSLLFSFFSLALVPATATDWKAGVAKVDITPYGRNLVGRLRWPRPPRVKGFASDLGQGAGLAG